LTERTAPPSAEELAARHEADPPVRDRLMTTLFLVASLHAVVILGVSFGAPSALFGEAPSLEVMVVQDPAPEPSPNPSADYLAQVNQHGAGTAADTRSLEAPHLASPTSAGPGASDLDDGEGTTEGRRGGDTTLVESRTRDDTEANYLRGSTGIRRGSPFVMDALSQSAAIAQTGDEVRLRGAPSRELIVTPNTRESSVAVYLDGWRRRIENLGTLNYPMQAAARRNASGNPVLEVQILADGNLGHAVIKRSSGFAELDQAALAILKLAAPFPPFPPRLEAKHDALRLTYEWQFQDGAPVESAVRVPANTE
jgi:periplasmic protein TonB